MKHLFLPLSGTTLVCVLKSSQPEILSSFDTDELLALSIISFLPNLPPNEHNGTIERIISDLFLSVQADPKGVREFFLQQITLADVQAGARLMTHFQLKPINADSVENRRYLRAGKWDFQFRRNYIGDLCSASDFGLGDTLVTYDQRRALSVSYAALRPAEDRIVDQDDAVLMIREGLEDPIHYDGYAGVGKSFLLPRIAETAVSMGIRDSQILVLTLSSEQIKNLPQELRKYRCLSYHALASSMLPKEYRGLFWKRSGTNAPWPYGKVESHLEIQPLDRYPVQRIFSVALSTIAKFCYSADPLIDETHLPGWVAKDLLDDDTQGQFITRYLVGVARQIWNLVLNPAQGIDIPTRVFYQVKLVALSIEVIDPKIKLIIMDETHELHPVVAQILDRSSQYVITFGDRYQRIQGSPVTQLAGRQVQLTDSFRSPLMFEDTINWAITSNGLYHKNGRFRGNGGEAADLQFFDQDAIPDKPTAIYVSDFWSYWLWAIRLAQSGVNFRTVTPINDVTQFVSGAISLKREGTRSAHRDLVKYWSYDQMFLDLQQNKSFCAIHELLDRGYTIKDWHSLITTLISGSATYSLGLVKDSRNTESKRVYLSSDISDLITSGAKGAGYNVMGAYYVALTRTRYALTLPGVLRSFEEKQENTLISRRGAH